MCLCVNFFPIKFPSLKQIQFFLKLNKNIFQNNKLQFLFEIKQFSKHCFFDTEKKKHLIHNDNKIESYDSYSLYKIF